MTGYWKFKIYLLDEKYFSDLTNLKVILETSGWIIKMKA